MLKRSFTIIHLVFIPMIAFLIVNLFYQFLATKLVVTPRITSTFEETTPVAPISFKPFSAYHQIVERDLFATVKKEEVEEEAPAVDPDELKKTELKLKLLGTITGIGVKPYAIIEDTKKKQYDLHEINDTIQNATIKKIYRASVVLTVNGEDEVLELNEGNMTLGTRSPKSSGRSSLPPSRSNQRISLKRTQIDESVRNLSKLMREVRIRPHFSNGKSDGLVLSGIKPRSIFRKMGLRNRDILVGVEGQEIRSADDALGLYQKLKESSSVNVQIKRQGELKEIIYDIQ